MDSRMWNAVSEWIFDPTVGKFVTIVAGIIIINVLIRATRRMILEHIESTDNRYRLRKMVNAIGTMLAIILVTVVFSDKLGNLTVAFGVTGAGIAFALQEVIASIAGWVAVSFGNFYSVGGLVPEARKTWRTMVNKYRIEDAQIEPMVTLIANDNWMEFTVRYVTDYKRRRSTKDILFTRILENFDATNGKVSLASATFHLVDAPVFNVRMANPDPTREGLTDSI